MQHKKVSHWQQVRRLVQNKREKQLQLLVKSISKRFPSEEKILKLYANCKG